MAMVGFGKLDSKFQRHSWLAKRARWRCFGLSSSSRKNSLMSWPAHQLSPSPVSTSTRTLGSSARSFSTSTISKCRSGLMAFLFSGRFRLTQAIPSSITTLTFFKSLKFMFSLLKDRERRGSAPERPMRPAGAIALQIDVDVLDLRIGQQFLKGLFAVIARLLGAAEGRRKEMARRVVYPDITGLDPAG